MAYIRLGQNEQWQRQSRSTTEAICCPGCRELWKYLSINSLHTRIPKGVCKTQISQPVSKYEPTMIHTVAAEFDAYAFVGFSVKNASTVPVSVEEIPTSPEARAYLPLSLGCFAAFTESIAAMNEATYLHVRQGLRLNATQSPHCANFIYIATGPLHLLLLIDCCCQLAYKCRPLQPLCPFVAVGVEFQMQDSNIAA